MYNFTIFLYQNRDEYNDSRNLIELVDEKILPRVHVYQLIDYSDMWEKEYYRDTIHPSSNGTEALAKILLRIINSK